MEIQSNNQIKKILIVDDEPVIRKLCSENLKLSGYVVNEAIDGKDALAKMKKERFDIALIDLQMPKMNGTDLLRRIKNQYPQTEVIIMTAYGTVETAVEAMKIGAYHYISKPFDISDLELLIKMCLERQTLRTEVSELKEVVNLYELGKAISSLENLEQLLNQILGLAIDTLKADDGSIMLFSDEKQALTVKASLGADKEQLLGKTVKVGERIAGWVAKNRTPVLLIGGIKNDQRFSNSEETRTDISSAISVPLLSKNKLLGVINLNRTEWETDFTKKDMNLLSIYASHAAIAIEHAGLYDDLNNLFISTIKSLAEAIDAKDPYTRGHSEKVAELSQMIAEELNFEGKDLKDIQLSALLHDIGKIGITEAVLRKKGELSDEEWIQMRQHPVVGTEILRPIRQLQNIIPNIMHHHERYNGKGYPSKLKGNDIPLGARIIAIADAFDAMTSERPYRPPLAIEKALEELIYGAGIQFDPRCVRVFIARYKKEQHIKSK